MTRLLPFHTYDVFTSAPYSGNPLAIVEQADHLTVDEMQIIAREFNLSETIFVQRPADADHTARVRIFFPTAEIPFAGHPTIGCSIHLASTMHAGESDWTHSVVLEEEAGLVPVEVVSREGSVSAQFTAPVIPHAHPGKLPPAEDIAHALALSPEDIGFGGHEPGLHAGGPAFLYVPVSASALLKASAREPYWSEVMASCQLDSAYLYTPGTGNVDYRARMFSPTTGIAEDPATGSATAIFARQLLVNGALSEGTNRLSLLQGVEMGRKSELGLEVDVAGGAITAVRVSGSAVPVTSGTIRPPLPQGT